MDTPDGMTIFSAPGISSRHCDLYWLRETDLNAKLIELQFERYPLRDNEWIRYKVYGDSIFPWQECVQSRYYGDNVTAREKAPRVPKN